MKLSQGISTGVIFYMLCSVLSLTFSSVHIGKNHAEIERTALLHFGLAVMSTTCFWNQSIFNMIVQFLKQLLWDNKVETTKLSHVNTGLMTSREVFTQFHVWGQAMLWQASRSAHPTTRASQGWCIYKCKDVQAPTGWDRCLAKGLRLLLSGRRDFHPQGNNRVCHTPT